MEKYVRYEDLVSKDARTHVDYINGFELIYRGIVGKCRVGNVHNYANHHLIYELTDSRGKVIITFIYGYKLIRYSEPLFGHLVDTFDRNYILWFYGGHSFPRISQKSMDKIVPDRNTQFDIDNDCEKAVLKHINWIAKDIITQMPDEISIY